MNINETSNYPRLDAGRGAGSSPLQQGPLGVTSAARGRGPVAEIWSLRKIRPVSDIRRRLSGGVRRSRTPRSRSVPVRVFERQTPVESDPFLLFDDPGRRLHVDLRQADAGERRRRR